MHRISMILSVLIYLSACDSNRLVLITIPHWPDGVKRCEIFPLLNNQSGQKIVIVPPTSDFAMYIPAKNHDLLSLKAQCFDIQDMIANGAIDYTIDAQTDFPLRLNLRLWSPPFYPGSGLVEKSLGVTGWHLYTTPSAIDFFGIWGTNYNDIWVVGRGGIIFYFNGHTWSQFPSGTTKDLVNLWGSSSNDIWAIGGKGTIIHWDGNTWTPFAPLCDSILRAIWGSDTNDVWAAGDGCGLLHWNGSTWSTVPVSMPKSFLVSGIWGSNSNDIWAIGFGDMESLMLHWDGKLWSIFPTPSAFLGWGIWGSASNNVWAVGGPGTIHWDGSAWAEVPTGSPFQHYRIWGSGPNDVWIAGDGRGILHWDGRSWIQIDIGEFILTYSIWGSDPKNLWMVGHDTRQAELLDNYSLEQGAIVHYQP